MMTNFSGLCGLAGVVAGLGVLIFGEPCRGEVPASRTLTYVANVENGTQPKVRYSGREWVVSEEGFLAGRGNGHQVMMTPPPAEGDFLIEAELELPQKGKRSAVTIGYDSRIVLTSGGGPVVLEGRFFRAGDKPIQVAGPELPAGKTITLVLERKAKEVHLSLSGREIFSGPCRPGALPMLGVDPMEGQVRLFAMSARGQFPGSGEEKFGNPFGMQRRALPESAGEVFAPVIVQEGPTNECAMVARRDGTLELYHVTKPSSDSVSVMRSTDGGITWGASEIAFPSPGRIYYAVMAAEGKDGIVHVVFHVLGQGPGGYRGRLYDVYHTRTTSDGKSWEKPKLIVPGYVGSIRGLIELTSGRLVLAVGLANPDRMEAPASGTDYGWNDTVVYTSDDKGSTWTKSPDVLVLPLDGENTTRYGAIEPAMVQLEDGRVWMLIRSRDGRFWESWSEDGTHWSEAKRTKFITSDSPACFVRLRDKRIILLANACQNWSNPRSYAMGGREVLQASVSSDEAKTWSGFRDVLHETIGPAGGDRGTAYASAAETKDGKICLFGGQGEGKRAIVLFDPDWLEETTVTDDLAEGPVLWVQYGDDGLAVENLADGGKAVVLPMKSSGLCGAAWNFPAAVRGEISLRLWLPKEAEGSSLSLNDHFVRVDDPKALENSVFGFGLDGDNGFKRDQWQNVVLRWEPGEATLLVDGKPVGTAQTASPSVHGLNYLRVEARSAKDKGAVKVADLIFKER